LRVYVPQGAKLVSFDGSEMKVQKYEELGKQVFEGFLVIYPEKKSLVKLVYEIPKAKLEDGKYSLFFQKQPGVNEMEVKATFGNNIQELLLRKDTKISF
jgi:hypothetical protein